MFSRIRPARGLVVAAAAAAAVWAFQSTTAGRQPPTNKQPSAGPSAGGKPLPDRSEVMSKARKYLEARYDMSGKTDPQVKMSGGRKGVPGGATARLQGVSW